VLLLADRDSFDLDVVSKQAAFPYWTAAAL